VPPLIQLPLHLGFFPFSHSFAPQQAQDQARFP
jgi:hypothetical protein